MSAIKPNKNFYNEPPEIINVTPYSSSFATSLKKQGALVPNKRLRDVYDRFFKEKNN
jgi:hypothetical protein